MKGSRSNKIVVRIMGGIGNQLFGYAAARRLALVNHAELVLDHVSGFKWDKYRRNYQLDHFSIPCRKASRSERLEPFSRVRRYLKRGFNRRLSFEKRRFITQEGRDFDRRLLCYCPCGTVHLEGNWQSEEYFKDAETTVRQDLVIRPPADATNLSVAAKIRKHNAVAVHVRFFDPPQTNGVNNVRGDYYSRAIAEMESRVPGAHYFLFSDRPDAALANVTLPASRVTIVAHNGSDELAYADLWLMTQCRHFIIANSTFSWWAAWLASHSEKQVIAPGLVLDDPGRITSWNFRGQIPSSWSKL